MDIKTNNPELNANLRKIRRNPTISNAYEDALATWTEATGKDPDETELYNITWAVIHQTTWRSTLTNFAGLCVIGIMIYGTVVAIIEKLF